MQIIRLVLSLIGLISLLPSLLLLPAIIITGIMGAKKKDYTYLKTYLIVWGISLIALVVIMTLNAIVTFMASSISAAV